MDLQGKKVLVFGAGISGIGSCGLLEKEGAEVILYDGNDKKDAEAMKAQLGEGSKVRVVLGAFPEEEMESLDLVVMSPGVPTDLPVVLAMKEKGIPVWGEIELAYVCGKGDVLGITGTNGKTTTTSLLGEIMKNARDSVFVVGNIGTPYTNAAADTREDSVIVAELSSFQLESIHTFHPKVSAVLNITPDHLNRHHTMEAYIRAKMNIAKNQTPEDICVLNYEDEETRKMADEFQASVLFFSSKHKLEQGIYLDGEDIVYKPEKEKEGTVICKTGGISKEEVGIPEEVKIHPGEFEAMCNPIAQAKLLNEQHTEFNIEVGLCVGHDSMFYKYSDAMVTTLVAKDRVLAHNPCGAIYCAEGYFKKRLE